MFFTAKRRYQQVARHGEVAADEEKIEGAVNQEDLLAEQMKELCKYYGVWETPPNAELRTAFILNDLVPKIYHNKIVASLHVRGIVVQVRPHHALASI